jgi:ABC-type transporter Mla subunit MlaD
VIEADTAEDMRQEVLSLLARVIDATKSTAHLSSEGRKECRARVSALEGVRSVLAAADLAPKVDRS